MRAYYICYTDLEKHCIGSAMLEEKPKAHHMLGLLFLLELSQSFFLRVIK